MSKGIAPILRLDLRLTAGVSSGEVRPHHLHESSLQKALKQAVRQVGIQKKVGCHTFRHSFATHLLLNRYRLSSQIFQFCFSKNHQAYC